MSFEQPDSRAAFLDEIVQILSSGFAASEVAMVADFGRHYLRRVPEGELEHCAEQHWAGLIKGQFELARRRSPRKPVVRVFNPSLDADGWESTHTVIEIINDDMPFLVDSTTNAIGEQNASIHLIIHPTYQVQRDAHGGLTAVAPGSTVVYGAQAESIMHFQIDRQTDQRMLAQLQEKIERNLDDVRMAVRDWRAMYERANTAADYLAGVRSPYPLESVQEACEFLRWLADNHFTFLGYREYELRDSDGGNTLHALPSSGLGILSSPSDDLVSRPLSVAPDPLKISASGPVFVTKTSARSTVHRTGHMDYVGILTFDEDGNLVGERRWLGFFTSAAYNRRPWNIPFVRHKVASVMTRSGYAAESHGGKALLHIMETLPRDELFQAFKGELYDLVVGIFDLQERQKTRLFIRADRFGRYFSCIVYIPRERFNTETRERIQGILKRALSGDSIDFAVQIGDSMLARVHVVIWVRGEMPDYDVREIEARLVEAVRTWHDKLRDILIDKHGEEAGLQWAKAYGQAFPAAYVEDVTPWVAAFDVENIAYLKNADDTRMSLYRPRRRHVGMFRFKVFRCDHTIPLSDILPILENMGLRIVSERPYAMSMADGSVRWIQDFDMQLARGGDLDLERVRHNFQVSFDQVVRGKVENDGFNRLVLEANLDWRQVTLLRVYCKFLLQTGMPFSQAYMERTLVAHPGIARLMVELFEVAFDPAREVKKTAKRKVTEPLRVALQSLLPLDEDKTLTDLLTAIERTREQTRDCQTVAIAAVLRYLIEGVRSLDEDRILRAFIDAIDATVRTNFYQLDEHGLPPICVSYKLDSKQLPELPKPRPWREIFIYSPRVEGIHLRGGPVARGGIRWSDRREDFRTEVLGLMKAQTVKNTMIVPVGAKGGFVVKALPESDDRDVVMAEVTACYGNFIHGLLSITDNLVDGELVHPPQVIRRDQDDPYLVVAADKGTAAFSDIANDVSAQHRFWLDDAFASGGSVGYDHKGMGITAKGAWESVKRHFREMEMDYQTQPFSVVGIGDMSGDVFGNGMLLSRQIKLQGAFNHAHIFLDPNPDPERSYRERERLFKLPRSAWSDYDTTLIGSGGGVFSRREKAIPISAEVKQWLGLQEDSLAPNDLIRALLKAPVDLLWNGGIGTYVKAMQESHIDVGDRANDLVRVDGRELRCKVVGEGGNLGLTQNGRIEYALRGGRINTDFIDNSAGVDCSDHEVNIKILLNDAMAANCLTVAHRKRLLVEMTVEVATLVLRNNYLQTQAISMMQALTVKRLGSQSHFIDVLESRGVLERELEHLPGHEELQDRRAHGLGLTRPELAMLLSYSKITLSQELLASDVPEDPYLSRELIRYFPQPLRGIYSDLMAKHRLRREIIATVVTNSVVNRMGATFILRMQEDTGATAGEVAKAFTVAREVLRARAWWEAIEAGDGKIVSERQIFVQLMIWNLVRHTTRWVLNNHRGAVDIAALVERYADGVEQLRKWVPQASVLRSKRLKQVQSQLCESGFDEALASEISSIPALNAATDIIETAREVQWSVTDVAEVYFRLDKVLQLSWLMNEIERLPVGGQWHANARGGLRDDLFRLQRALTSAVLAQSQKEDVIESVRRWQSRCEPVLIYFERMLADMKGSGGMDYATVSVAVRGLEHLIASTGAGVRQPVSA